MAGFFCPVSIEFALFGVKQCGSKISFAYFYNTYG